MVATFSHFCRKMRFVLISRFCVILFSVRQQHSQKTASSNYFRRWMWPKMSFSLKGYLKGFLQKVSVMKKVRWTSKSLYHISWFIFSWSCVLWATCSVSKWVPLKGPMPLNLGPFCGERNPFFLMNFTKIKFSHTFWMLDNKFGFFLSF